MSRSGYTEDIEDDLALGRYRQAVNCAIQGKRGQAFLRELAAAMDAMEEKWLIRSELIDEDGDCCTIGVVCQARGMDVSQIDCEEPDQVAAAVGIARSMAAEIEFENDDDFSLGRDETPEGRWKRMRAWVERHIRNKPRLARTRDEVQAVLFRGFDLPATLNEDE